MLSLADEAEVKHQLDLVANHVVLHLCVMHHKKNPKTTEEKSNKQTNKQTNESGEALFPAQPPSMELA